MIDPSKSFLLDLNFRTALLESLNWDETQFDSLLKYLIESLNKNIDFPENILEQIKLEYGIAAHDLIKQIFVDAYIENGLYIKPGGDYEH